MITPFPEANGLTPPEGKASESPRRAALSVDKFADHLHRQDTKVGKKPSPSPKSTSAMKPTPRDQNGEYHHCAEPKPSSKKVTDPRPGDAEMDQKELDPSGSDLDDQGRELPIATHVAVTQTVIEANTTEATTVLETVSAGENAAAAPQQPGNSPLSLIESQVNSSSASKEGSEEVAIVSVEGDLSLNDPNSVASNLDSPLESGAADVSNQAPSNSGVLTEPEKPAQTQPLVPHLEVASQNKELAPPAEGGAKIPQATSDAAQVSFAPTTKEPIKETFSEYLFGKSQSDAALSNLGNDPALLPRIEALSDADQSRDESDRASEDATNASASEHTAESPSILTPSDAAQAVASTLPNNLRRHMETHSAGAPAAPATPPVTDAQHARLLQRVSRAFRAADERGGEVQIRLSPPELGSMKLELSLNSGVLTAKIEVENQRAQTILLDSVSTLRDRLADQGIRVEKFEVGLQQRDSSGQQPQHQQHQSERTSRAISHRNRAVEPTTHPESPLQTRAPQGASRLNVIV